jgi:DNA-binding protein HU-beta
MALVGKDELVREVAERSELGVGETRRVLEETFRAIEEHLGKGDEVRLTGFGKFSVSKRKARKGRNPQTGESMKIAAKTVPRFSAGAELKKAVEQRRSRRKR